MPGDLGLIQCVHVASFQAGFMVDKPQQSAGLLCLLRSIIGGWM